MSALVLGCLLKTFLIIPLYIVGPYRNVVLAFIAKQCLNFQYFSPSIFFKVLKGKDFCIKNDIIVIVKSNRQLVVHVSPLPAMFE